MTTGALIFAFNNEQTDYVSMAEWSAKNIERHLGIPTRIVTNKDVATSGTNQRWFGDYETTVTWHNESRTDAYTLSPWDQTLVLDADYVVASDQLKTLLESNQDFLAHRLAYDVVGVNDFSGLNYFGYNQMPMWWATVMMFRKTAYTQHIFECMAMIKNNWTHYKKLYRNYSPSYRNDHALTIALGTVNGHTLDYPGIPWNLASLTPEHKITQIGIDEYRVDFLTSDQKPRWIVLKNQDFHAMGKQQLGEIVADPC
jgi:hypothetical protein